MRAAWAALAVWTASATLAPGAARGNGAFPESDAVLLAADRPREILLATNFGIILTEDDGATWQWTCEQPETSMGALYGIGAAPANRLYSVSPDVGLAVSSDGSCTWRQAGGALADLLASDYFADPTDPSRVLAIATTAPADGGAGGASVFVSNDGGESFDPSPMFRAPAGAALLAVEIARADPHIVVLAMLLAGSHPALVRTTDGGGQWTTIDVEPALGPHPVRIVAIDATDPDVITLRVQVPGGDVLAVSHDGGASFRTPITVPDGGTLTAFVRLASGTMLAAGLVPIGGPDAGGATRGVAWRSSDGGLTFEDWTLSPQPHLVALAQRGGKLYLAGKNYSDGWAMAVSTDEGRTLTPLMSYDQVTSIKECAMSMCQESCDSQAGVKIWEPEVCTGALRDGGRDGGPPAGGGGCGCATSPARDHDVGGLAPIAMLALCLARSRHCRCARPPRSRRA
jgi:hypothetical protein